MPSHEMKIMGFVRLCMFIEKLISEYGPRRDVYADYMHQFHVCTNGGFSYLWIVVENLSPGTAQSRRPVKTVPLFAFGTSLCLFTVRGKLANQKKIIIRREALIRPLSIPRSVHEKSQHQHWPHSWHACEYFQLI